MKVVSRIAVLFLLFAGLASAITAQTSFGSSRHEKPAGCHEHGKSTPKRGPADYRCCVAGHESAAVRPVTNAPLDYTTVAIAAPPIEKLSLDVFHWTSPIAATPPKLSIGDLPLRI
jgi:hypothetical protein